MLNIRLIDKVQTFMRLPVFIILTKFTAKQFRMNYKTIMLSALVLIAGLFQQVFSQSKSKSFYQIKIYHVQGKEQESLVDNYLRSAYLPALNRHGVKNVGVFKPIGNDTLKDQRIYVLIPFKSMNQFVDIPAQMEKDQQMQTSGSPYLEALYNKPPYSRLESILLSAFSEMPELQLPALKNDPAKRVYELRSYESATEEIFKNKVHMFNEGGEVKLFKRLGFNAVFYGSVIAGSRMPNLMYMTTFEDMASRDEHWKAFSNDPVWKKLSAMKEYQNNVSRSEILFLRPTDYSGI
jgi:hypothetical protein